MDSVIQPKRPVVQGWRLARGWACPPPLVELGYPVQAWEHPSSGLFALSAVEVAFGSVDVAFGRVDIAPSPK